MRRPGLRPQPARWWLVALLGVLAFGAYIRWTPRALVADLRPAPDAIEYEEAAYSIAQGRGYLLWIGDKGYPPRYPPGMSLLIAASLPLVGTAPGSGIWVVLASALAAIAGTYALAHVAAGPAAGVVAALLVATSPLHVRCSRAVMSDIPATAAVAWLSAWLIASLRRRTGVLEHAALGFACGLAVSVRQPLAVLAPSACIMVGLLSVGTPRERMRNALVLGAGVLVGLLPLLWLNMELFGHPLHTGYGYWAPGQSFSPAWVAQQRGPGGTSNAWFYATLLAGGRALYAWPAAVLLLIGTVVAARRDRTVRTLVLLAWLFTILFLMLHLGYSGLASRLLLPILPLLAAVMAIPCAAGSRTSLRATALALVAVAVVLQSSGPNSYRGATPPAFDVATLEKIAAVAEPNAAILAHTNPFVFARVLRRDADRVWVPLRLSEHQRAIQLGHLAPVRRDDANGGWIRNPLTQPFDRAAALATVEELCRSGRPVYLSGQLAGSVKFLRPLERALRRRFGLTQVVAPEPYAVYRVACPATG